MKIQSILPGYEASALGSPRGELAIAASDQQPASVSSGPASARFREILARYDVRHISPREFSELVQKLSEAGEISQADVQELSMLRLELDKAQHDADQPLDLIDFLQDKLHQQDDQVNRHNRRQPDQPIDRDAALRLTRRQLDWLEKFATVQSGRGNPALDQVV